MGLIEDFLNNNVPQAPPPPEPQPKQDKRLGNWSLSKGAKTEEVETEPQPQAEVPPVTKPKHDNTPYFDSWMKEHGGRHPSDQRTDETFEPQPTVDLSTIPPQQPMPDLKELNKDRNTTQQEKVAKAVKGMKPNYYETQTTTKTKAPSERVEVTERIGTKQAYKDWEKESSPYNKVLEQLRLNPPKKPVDSERMRKMAGVQAISEALRNVVDAVQGQRKAIIVPHKAYTNEFLKEATKADADYASQLAKWQKTLSETQKSAFEMYLKEVAQNDKTNIRKVITNTGESTTTTRDTEGRRTFAPRSNYGRSGSGKQPPLIMWAKTGEQKLLTPEIARAAFNEIVNTKVAGQNIYPKERESFVTTVTKGGYTPTLEDYALFIQEIVDMHPEASRRVARLWDVQEVRGSTTTAENVERGKFKNRTVSGKQINKSPVANTPTKTSSKTTQPTKNQANTNPYAKYKE